MVVFFQSRDRHFSRRRRRRPPRTMLTTIPTTTQTRQTTSKGGRRRRRRSVARRAMRSSVDARFDEASSSSSSSEASGVHVVSPGDSLYGVAVHYGVDPRDLIVRRRDFLPSFRRRRPFFSSSNTTNRLFSPRRLRESGSSLCILNSKRNAMTLTKRYAGETDSLILFDCEYYSQRQQQAANAKTLGGFEYVLPGQRLVIPGRMASGGGQQHQSVETNSNSALDGGERRRRQQQRQQVYKSGNISSNFLAEKGGPTTTMTRMPTIVTAVSFVFGLAFGLFLFSRERE